ncbi:hypothetical protein KSS87_009246 [Heliosperma pusillum]|nr:hypothetical protein KSS87_009246 [Heliosperma pusillum]
MIVMACWNFVAIRVPVLKIVSEKEVCIGTPVLGTKQSSNRIPAFSMSRCFPFPPPGYEKKLIVDGVTLLAKEKDKEKRHKKDKDKSKKEGNEKDKQRSKERRKEKDKEKHKHKDRGKKDAKKRSRYEKSFEDDRSNVDKVGSSSPQSSCLQELEQRTSFVDGTTGSQTVHSVASRRNGVDWTEGKGGLDQTVNGPKINNQSNFPKVAFIFSNGLEQRTVQIGRHMENNISKSTEAKEMQIHPNGIKKEEKCMYKNAKRHKGEAKISTPRMFGYDGVQADPLKVVAVVQDPERGIRDESGVTRSQVGINANATIQQKAQNLEKGANGYAISFSQTKGNFRLKNGRNSMENGQKDNNQSKVPKVAIVHNIKVEKRECEVAGAVGTSRKALTDGVGRNEYNDKGVIDNRKKIQSKDEHRYKSVHGCEVAGAVGTSKKASVDGIERNAYSEKGVVEKIPSKDEDRIKSVQGCEVAGAVGTSKKAPVEGIERNAYSKKGVLDTRMKITFKDEGRSKPREDEKMKEKAYNNTVELTKYGQNGSDSAVSSKKHFSFKMGNKSAETITGKRKESEAIGILPDNETRPQKAQKSVLSLQPAAENERHLKPSTTISLSKSKTEPVNGFKLDGVEHKPKWTMGAQSPPVPTNSELSVAKVPGNTGSQETSLVSIKPPIVGVNVNGTIGAHGSPSITTKAIEHKQKVHAAVGHQESAKPPLTAGNVNGTIAAHGSSPVTLKLPSTSRKEKGKEKRKGKSSSKPLPPHPDTKYLSQILSVPKMEEPPEFDDTDWLFENKRSSSKEGDCNVCYNTDGGEHVWAKAVHFESADVYALPYVIPY